MDLDFINWNISYRLGTKEEHDNVAQNSERKGSYGWASWFADIGAGQRKNGCSGHSSVVSCVFAVPCFFFLRSARMFVKKR